MQKEDIFQANSVRKEVQYWDEGKENFTHSSIACLWRISPFLICDFIEDKSHAIGSISFFQRKNWFNARHYMHTNCWNIWRKNSNGYQWISDFDYTLTPWFYLFYCFRHVFFNFWNFCWGIVDLPCYVSFWCTAE